jgi:hypothetical protein
VVFLFVFVGDAMLFFFPFSLIDGWSARLVGTACAREGRPMGFYPSDVRAAARPNIN